jgi:hypothetical protein
MKGRGNNLFTPTPAYWQAGIKEEGCYTCEDVKGGVEKNGTGG